MIRLAYCSLLALAGCPAKKTTPQSLGAGCPSAANVYIATYVKQEQGHGRSGWVVPLHATTELGDIGSYTNIDPTTAGAAGTPVAPSGTLWLATASAPPCRATLGKYYAAKIDGPPASATYGVEVEGCPPPKGSDEGEGGGFILVSEQSPGGCRFEAPRPIAARVGVMNANKQWQKPTKETPIPEPIAATLPAKECAAPACEKLWAFLDVKIDNKTVAWSGVVNWLRVDAAAEQCTWKSDRESGIWIPTNGGAVKVTEGQEHPLPMSAVLADGDGAKVILAEGPGDYATYDLAAGRAKLGHRIKWQVFPADVWDQVDNVGPFCEPKR